MFIDFYSQRDAFVERLLDHSETGRLHDQDAVLQLPKTKDPDALLSLPEFIREPMPPSSQASGSHSIPGSLNEPGPEDPVKMKVKQRSRGRSASAPPISWLRPSSIRSALQESSSQRTHRPHTSKGQELSINGEHRVFMLQRVT